MKEIQCLKTALRPTFVILKKHGGIGSRYYDPYIRRWLSIDPAGPHDHSNLYQYVFNNPFTYCDPSGEAAFLIPFLILGAEITLPTITSIVTPILLGATTTAIGYGAYKAGKSINAKNDTYSAADDYAEYSMRFDAEFEEEERKKHNTNPFGGPVREDVVVVDEAGNAIKIPQGNWATGTTDGKWIQVRDKDGAPTGERKDGGGHPRENDVRGREPHGHVPGISNSDGTPWLPIKK